MWGNIIRGIDGKDLRFDAICLQRMRRKQIVFFIVNIAVFLGDRILFASYFSGEVSIFQGRYRCDEVFEKLPQLMLFF